MSRETFKLLMAIGVLLNSALYLVGCLIAGLIMGRPVVYDLALAALGVTYLSYTCHFAAGEGDTMHGIALLLVYVSIILGVGTAKKYAAPTAPTVAPVDPEKLG